MIAGASGGRLFRREGLVKVVLRDDEDPRHPERFEHFLRHTGLHHSSSQTRLFRVMMDMGERMNRVERRRMWD